MDASLPAARTRHPGVDASSRGGPGAAPAFPSEPAVPEAESRDELVVRRRAAQRAWRAACDRTEQASQYLRDVLDTPLSAAAAKARECLEHAQHGELRARSSYYRVAEETGVLLSRLERAPAGPA
jgi:hypothetical protein